MSISEQPNPKGSLGGGTQGRQVDREKCLYTYDGPCHGACGTATTWENILPTSQSLRTPGV